MKGLFIVACKVLGLFQLYFAMGTIAQVGVWLSMKVYSSPEGGMLTPSFYWTLIHSFLSFALAFILLFKTDLLVRITGLSESESIPQLPSPENLLRIGILLLGVFLVFRSIPDLIKQIFRLHKYIGVKLLHKDGFVDSDWLSAVLGAFCQFVLALLLLLKPDAIIKRISTTE